MGGFLLTPAMVTDAGISRGSSETISILHGYIITLIFLFVDHLCLIKVKVHQIAREGNFTPYTFCMELLKGSCQFHDITMLALLSQFTEKRSMCAPSSPARKVHLPTPTKSILGATCRHTETLTWPTDAAQVSKPPLFVSPCPLPIPIHSLHTFYPLHYLLALYLQTLI